MAEHNDLGNRAEMLASQWLQKKGYVLLAQNYRFKHAEIDLIMEFKGLLIFVEVKYRSGIGFGYAEEFVDFTKKKLLVKAADAYIHEIDWHKDIRFDIMGVYKDKQGNINFRQFEDAFY
ncbi:YraN family protein [Algoriphagus sp. PAP.12]|uniref:YraN family protein n=1 Tax=Algoriphagus sp. PAP.12 TaxID=2996678 RepID=UPI00227AF13F|nr:YraN family protein [Algoriphagus sp. PAP.12]